MLCRKQIAAHLRRESVAAIDRQSTQGHCREQRERRQRFPGDWLRRPDIRLEWIQTTFHQVHQCVPHPAGGRLIPVVRPDDLPAAGEDDFHQIHKSPADHFHSRSIGLAAKERPAPALYKRAVVALQPIAIGTAHRQVKQSVRTEGESVQTAVVGVTEAGEDHRALVRAAIVIGVIERDQIRRVGHEERAMAPDQAHREDQIVGKNAPGIEAPVAVLVFEQFHPAHPCPGGDLGIQVQPGRLGHEQTPAFIERGKHREDHLLGARDLFDDEILRGLELWRGKCRRGGDRRGCDGSGNQRGGEPGHRTAAQ